MKLVFVGATRGNRFIDEILLAVEYAVRAEGVETAFVRDALPPDEDAVYVLIPHEFFECVSPEAHPDRRQLSRTIALCVEQPGTKWFDLSAAYAARAAAVVDIQRTGVEELRRRGIAAEHFRLGYTDYWDRWRGSDVERDLDVVYLGSANERRSQILAGYAQTLWRRRTRLLMPPEAPKTDHRSDFYTGDEKWDLLASAKTLLNVHRQDVLYFEWVRVLEAVANGCVVVSEHSIDVDPFVPGEHFVSGSAGSLALLADRLLDDPGRLRTIREQAYELIRSELPMQPAAARLAELATAVRDRRGRRPVRRAPAVRPRVGAFTDRVARRAAQTAFRAVRNPTIDWLLASQGESRQRLDTISAATKRVVLQQIETRRTLARLEQTLAGGGPDVRTLVRTPACEARAPRVTVGIPLHNHSNEVQRALESVAGSEYRDFEILVVDDASSDCSAAVVETFLAEHPSIAGRLLQHSVNRGLGGTRNAVFEHANGEFVFALDADNEIYPTTLGRLVEILDAHPAAVFAYTILEERTAGVPSGLRSALPWDPARLGVMNYIDAMSLLRRDAVLELGGYTEDIRMYGWEDYDLWCRVAAGGGYGVFVPEILCRYNRSPHSMLSITDIDASEMLSLLRERYPSVMAPAA